jgi:hypothetical protein
MNIATWPKPNAPSSDPEDLPTALANIPETSHKANDLAFGPGTDRAKDAVMDSAIPQTEAPPPPSRPTPPSRLSSPQASPAQRPTIRTEPRDGDSISAERDARNRGAVMSPQGRRQK